MATSITINDIVFIEQIIKICQSRGAFRPEEMVDVGALYKKITEFLKTEVKSDEKSEGQSEVNSNLEDGAIRL